MQVQLLEGLRELGPVAAQGVEDTGHAAVAVFGQLEQEDTAVVIRALASDEARLLGALDELGHGGLAEIEPLAELGHGPEPIGRGLVLEEEVVALGRPPPAGYGRLAAPH